MRDIWQTYDFLICLFVCCNQPSSLDNRSLSPHFWHHVPNWISPCLIFTPPWAMMKHIWTLLDNFNIWRVFAFQAMPNCSNQIALIKGPCPYCCILAVSLAHSERSCLYWSHIASFALHSTSDPPIPFLVKPVQTHSSFQHNYIAASFLHILWLPILAIIHSKGH